MKRVRILEVDGDFQVVDENGIPVGVGLFAYRRRAAEFVREQRWFVIEAAAGPSSPEAAGTSGAGGGPSTLFGEAGHVYVPRYSAEPDQP